MTNRECVTGSYEKNTAKYTNNVMLYVCKMVAACNQNGRHT